MLNENNERSLKDQINHLKDELTKQKQEIVDAQNKTLEEAKAAYRNEINQVGENIKESHVMEKQELMKRHEEILQSITKDFNEKSAFERKQWKTQQEFLESQMHIFYEQFNNELQAIQKYRYKQVRYLVFMFSTFD
ncbi:hypothetical protein RFI_12730 [Reticulomyxa filosa]|uniref:Uncharacterized protein n=1 Tax=Reticulomyxa filosa TaxID=46433 RepID=X6NFC1_RETFI|nr:hypothetical protein RFI_12730 [Reticulomyxa filosa]|eukprot:ETO24424.1 hypothetical protein RFI_12730 [Reticulomyxa filosa]